MLFVSFFFFYVSILLYSSFHCVPESSILLILFIMEGRSLKHMNTSTMVMHKIYSSCCTWRTNKLLNFNGETRFQVEVHWMQLITQVSALYPDKNRSTLHVPVHQSSPDALQLTSQQLQHQWQWLKPKMTSSNYFSMQFK